MIASRELLENGIRGRRNQLRIVCVELRLGSDSDNASCWTNGVDDRSSEANTHRLPGPLFTVNHSLACCSDSATIFVSCSLLVYLFRFSRHVQSNHSAAVRSASTDLNVTLGEKSGQDEVSTRRSSEIGRINATASMTTLLFRKWNIGEWFVAYLAIVDFIHAVANIITYASIVALFDFPPERICKILGFLLNTFYVGQWAVFFLALCAFSLVVLNKQLRLGRADWRLLVAVFGCSPTLGVIAAGLDVLGLSGSSLV